MLAYMGPVSVSSGDVTPAVGTPGSQDSASCQMYDQPQEMGSCPPTFDLDLAPAPALALATPKTPPARQAVSAPSPHPPAALSPARSASGDNDRNGHRYHAGDESSLASPASTNNFWQHQVSHDQQSPDAKQQLARLLLRCRDERAPNGTATGAAASPTSPIKHGGTRPSFTSNTAEIERERQSVQLPQQPKDRPPGMAEALLGLAPAPFDDATGSKVPVNHLDYLGDHLRRQLEIKSLPTRAEHVSATFDVKPVVQFSISEGGDDAPSAGNANANPDVAGDGATPSPDPQTTNFVRANDVVMNQPQDDPVQQRSVAKNIMALVSATDGSSWAVRDISRGAQGWTFTYVCKNSLAAWKRQNAKEPAAKAIIGEYSLKEPDPVIFSRPAFDCRGSVSIAFSKSTRSINVKYDHTALHKSVAEMMAHFCPPPPPPPLQTSLPQAAPTVAEASATSAHSAEKPKKTPRKRKSETATADDASGGGASSQSNKRRKKTLDAVVQNAPEAAMTTADPADPTSHNTNPAPTGEAQADASSSGADQGRPGATAVSGDMTSQAKADEVQAVVQSGVHSQALLNVPPAEAARRRETAIRILSGEGVDPQTLSTEQFSIFANQSPDLQKESLAMFVKYGAERLRIVHPKDASASNAANTPEQPAQQGLSTATQALESPGPGATQASTTATGITNDDSTTKPVKTPKPRVSRGSCVLCRSSKTKCDREKPACGACQQAGIQCEYPLAQPRVSKGGGSATKSYRSAAPVEETEEEPQPEPATNDEPSDIETMDYTSNMPVATMLTPAADVVNNDYFGASSAGMQLNRQQTTDLAADHGVKPSNLTYPDPAHADPTQAEAQPAAASSAQPASGSWSPQARKRQAHPGRHRSSSRPAEEPSSIGETTTYLPQYTSAWQAANPGHGDSTSSQSQATTQQAAIGQQRYMNSAQAALRQHQHQQSASPVNSPGRTVTPAQQSPSQAPAQTARAQSRTGQRSQTRTPLGGQQRTSTPSHHMMTQQNMTPAAPAPAVSTSTYETPTDISGITSYNLYDKSFSSSDSRQYSTRLGYEPYVAQTASTATPSTYSSQSAFSGKNLPSSVSDRDQQSSTHQPSSNLYATAGSTAASAASSNQWSQSQAHNGQAYGTNTSSHSSSQQPATMPQSSRSTTSHVAPQHDTAFGYSSSQNQERTRQQQSSHSGQHQQQPPGWYGGFTTGNSASAYDNRGGGGGGGGHGYGTGSAGYHGQQHGHLNMSGHGYGGGDSDLFDLLKTTMHR